MLYIGKTIKRIRQQRELSQQQLAELAELTPSFLSLLENDRRKPSLLVLERIAAALKMPVEVIYWDAVEIPANLSPENKKICNQAKDIVQQLLGQTHAIGTSSKTRRN